MRVGCVLIHNFAVQLARRDNPELCGCPLIISDAEANTVFDACPEAIACSVRPGMPLRQAVSLCPEAVAVPRDNGYYDTPHDQVLSLLDEFSPTVEVAGLGCAYLDLSGVGDEESIAFHIREGISTATGLSASVGIASAKFLSWLAAFSARPQTPVVIANGGESQFVAPFSITLLPCSEGTKERLKLLGFRFIWELGNFSKEALTAQFGKEGITLYELTRGMDGKPLVAKKKPEVVSATAQLEQAAERSFETVAVCEHLLEMLLAQARAKEKVCREVNLSLRLQSGLSEQKRLPLKEPTCLKEKLVRRLRTWLEKASFSGAVAELEVSLILESDKGRRVSLWSDKGAAKKQVSMAASELSKRFGYQPMKKAIAVEPQPLLPDRRFRLIDLDY